MTLSLIQSAPKLNRTNLAMACSILNTLPKGNVAVFGELALNGYLLQDKLLEDAWSLEDLVPLLEASMQRDIVIGAALWENEKVYNCALYLAEGKILHIHQKNHLPSYGMFEEGRYFACGKQMDPFETSYGCAVMIVCEDLWRASTIQRLNEAKPDIVYVLAASPARGFNDNGLLIEDQWDALLKSIALLSQSYVIFVNRVGFEDGLGFWGGSRVISPLGKAEHQCALFEEEILEINLNHRLQKVERYIAKYV